MNDICPIIQAWAQAGRFDIDELAEHVKTCAKCRYALVEVLTRLWLALEQGGAL